RAPGVEDRSSLARRALSALRGYRRGRPPGALESRAPAGHHRGAEPHARTRALVASPRPAPHARLGLRARAVVRRHRRGRAPLRVRARLGAPGAGGRALAHPHTHWLDAGRGRRVVRYAAAAGAPGSIRARTMATR